jgi:hypothetical protein
MGADEFAVDAREVTLDAYLDLFRFHVFRFRPQRQPARSGPAPMESFEQREEEWQSGK